MDMTKLKSLTKYNKRNCILCGKECTGKYCMECAKKGKRGSISRNRISRRYRRKNQ